MTSKHVIRSSCAALAGLALLSGPASFARAGSATIVTAHSTNISLHAKTEFTDKSGNDKTDSSNASQKDLYQACVGTKPTKTQGIYAFFTNATDISGNCTTPPTKIDLVALDTSPLTNNGLVGTITLGDPLIETTKSAGATLTAIKVPATVAIDCGGTTTADLHGILNLNYKQFTKGGPICPISGSLKVTGSATNPSAPNDLVIDDGSSIKINTRDGGISVEPGL
ncbi:MAG TPA: hypothetical protein VMR31_04990 [Myxococcota bacterium]|nr:hypothetical protein [Myxococcota bacterium]